MIEVVTGDAIAAAPGGALVVRVAPYTRQPAAREATVGVAVTDPALAEALIAAISRAVRDAAQATLAPASAGAVRDAAAATEPPASARAVRDAAHATLAPVSARVVRDAAQATEPPASARAVRDAAQATESLGTVRRAARNRKPAVTTTSMRAMAGGRLRARRQSFVAGDRWDEVGVGRRGVGCERSSWMTIGRRCA